MRVVEYLLWMLRLPLLLALVALPGLAYAQVDVALVARTVECKDLNPARCPAMKTILDAGPAAWGAVRQALRSTDQAVRARASQLAERAELGTGPERSRDLVADLAATPDAVRGELLEALGRVKDPGAVPVLAAAVRDARTDARNRLFAANALGALEGDVARDALVAALRDDVPRVQLAAAFALGERRDPATVPALIDRALEEITAAYVREAAAAALGRMKDPRALAPLVVLLGCPALSVRVAAAHALAQLGDTAATPALVAKLGDAELAPALTEALGALMDKRAAAPLASLAVAPTTSAELRRKALWSVGELADPATVETLKPLLASEDPELAREAVEALGRIGDRSAVVALIPMLEYRDHEVQKTTVWALEKLTEQRFGLKIEAWKAWRASRE